MGSGGPISQFISTSSLNAKRGKRTRLEFKCRACLGQFSPTTFNEFRCTKVPHLPQRRQRSVRTMVGVFPPREPLFLVVADDARAPVRRNLDQSDAAVVIPAHADAGKISGFATREQRTEFPPPFGGQGTAGAIDLLVPEKLLGKRSGKDRSKRSPQRVLRPKASV